MFKTWPVHTAIFPDIDRDVTMVALSSQYQFFLKNLLNIQPYNKVGAPQTFGLEVR